MNPSQQALEVTLNHPDVLDGSECHPVETRPLERNLEENGKMTITKQVTVWCDTDQCQNFIQTDTALVAAARTEARGAGWRHDGTGDLCPEHARPAA